MGEQHGYDTALTMARQRHARGILPGTDSGNDLGLTGPSGTVTEEQFADFVAWFAPKAVEVGMPRAVLELPAVGSRRFLSRKPVEVHGWYVPVHWIWAAQDRNRNVVYFVAHDARVYALDQLANTRVLVSPAADGPWVGQERAGVGPRSIGARVQVALVSRAAEPGLPKRAR